MKKALIALATIVALTSCHANFDKTPAGLVYKIFPGNGGMKLNTAKFAKLSVEYRIVEKDSVLFTTYGKFPKYTPIDTAQKQPTYSEIDILPKCSVGDSIEFSICVDTLRNHGINLPFEIFPKGGHIKGHVKILAAFADRPAIMADYAKEQDKEKDRELASVETYMAKNNLKGQKTKNGVYVIVDQPGDGMKADSGKVASIMYKGTLMTDGTVFDTNMDTTKHHTAPISVTVGEHHVIPGWEDALPYFGKGGKGKILVPAVMGYGAQAQGPIPANADLVFDIEVLDVKVAPPAAPAPQMMMPGQHPKLATPPPATH